MMAARKTRWTACWLSISLLAAATGCSPRKAVEKAVRGARSHMEAGDGLLLEGRFGLAGEEYAQASSLLERVEGKTEGLPRPLQDLFRKTEEEVSWRGSAYEKPSGGIEAAFRLTGNPDTRELGIRFWDVEAMCRQGLSQEKWTNLSKAGQEQLVTLCSQALRDFLENNQVFLREAELAYQPALRDEQGTRVKSTIRFGKDTIKALFHLGDDSGLWRVTDMRLSVAGISVGQLIANTIALMEELHPLEELLARQDARDLMEKAAGMAMERFSKERGEAGSMVTLVKETALVTDSGKTFQIPGGRAVEFLGERRTVEGVVQVRVRILGHVDAYLSDRPTAGSQEGWIQEASLPSTGEEEVWGGD